MVDATAPTLSETTPVPTTTTTYTPSYTFTSSEPGTIAYGGSCSSVTVTAVSGENTVVFNELDEGAYAGGTITVTDAAGNTSAPLVVSPFTIERPSPESPVSTSPRLGHPIVAVGTEQSPAYNPSLSTPPVAQTPVPPAGTATPLAPSSPQGVSQNPGYVFSRTLAIGVTDSEVTELQKYLNGHGFTVATSGAGSSGRETNYFGVLTKRALVVFQEAYAAEILAPLGLTSGTGIFGLATRQYINAHR